MEFFNIIQNETEDNINSYDPSSDSDEDTCPIWEMRETCSMSLNKQGCEIWKQLRIGRNQGSLMAEICERSFHNEKYPKRTPEELAKILCGLSKQSYTNTQQLAMSDGVNGEPYIREWFSKDIIKRPIRQVGAAIWNKDPYYVTSLDGETENDEGDLAAIEIKIPGKINRKYIEVFHAWSKGVNNPHPESYIFRSHYDQITTANIITGKNGCYYVVACLNDGTAFHQYLDTDHELWEQTLYPKSKTFHNKYVMPLIRKYNVQVVFPPSN